jgi:gliding motility-associated-like protein
MPYANQLSVHEAYIGCDPLVVNLECDPENAIDVQWWFSNNAQANGANATLTFDAGVYDAMLVTVSPFGCNDTLFLENYVTVMAPPSAYFTVDSGVILDPTVPPVTFNFTNLSVGGTSYSWFFNDNTSDTAFSPVHTFPQPGFYDVMLVAVNEAGCNDTMFRRMEVEVPANIFVPNTFTPNGDGLNDLLKLYGDGVRSYHLRIYDRWGEKVFDTEDGISTWDGNFQGKPLNTAVFIYIADVELLDGRSIQRVGDITLLR